MNTWTEKEHPQRVFICPVCSGDSFAILASTERVEQECKIRERFIHRRLTRPASRDELKDLTDFFHAEKADILSCTGCRLLLRNEGEPPPAHEYSEDQYDPAVIEHLYPRYLNAFRRKETPYRSLLPPGARIVEVGSHYGAFLQTAQEWGWQVEGVDVGKDTSRFAQSKGFTVHACELVDCTFPPRTFDGVFIWNCFEQIDNPRPLLNETARILKPNGLLVVRTPNGLFYSMCENLLAQETLPDVSKHFLVDAMGYNNLLGFPYLYGHNRSTLQQLIERFGFRCEGLLNSELLTLPLPEDPEWVAREEHLTNAEIRMLANSAIAQGTDILTGPWIEMWFRVVSKDQATSREAEV